MSLFRRNQPEPDPKSEPAVTPPSPTPATTSAAGPQTVTLMDGFGRPQQLSREQWRKEVLPKVVEAYQHAPDRLAAMILQHLQQGLGQDLLPAALRLAALDPDVERGLSILAAVQRDIGELDAAEATLAELEQKRPDSPAAKVGQAMLMQKRGDQAAGMALLWAALQMDANHPDALHGLLSWRHEQGGDEGYQAAVAEACALPGAWRAKLWRARAALQSNQVEAALADCRAVAAKAGDESDALYMMANDLGRAGQLDAIQELVLPRYRIERHHPGIGVALLSYYHATKQPGPGMELLHQLRVRFQRTLDAQLGPFDAEFTRMTVPPAQPIQGSPKVVLFRMDRPLWYGALGKPEFLLPRPQEGQPRALLAGLSVAQEAIAPAMVQKEDELGRLARSVPLFLAEQLWLIGKVPAAVALPVAEGGGWIVSGAPWAEDKLAELLSDEERKSTRIVTGTVRPDGKQRRVDLWVYDAAQKQRIGHATATGEDGKLGAVLVQLLAELSPLLGGPDKLTPPVGSETFWDRYATGLAQLAALVIAAQGAMPKERVFGHRAILEWLLALALDERRSVQARMLLSAGLCADAAIGSKVHLELAAPYSELFRLEPPNSPFALTALPALRALGLEELWRHRREQIAGAGGEVYRAWLQRLEGTGSKG